MNYEQATNEIFEELKEYFSNGALGIEPDSINKAYSKRNLKFDFDKTKKYFKSQNLLFTKLIDAPEPYNFHAELDPNCINYFFLYDKSTNKNPMFLQCV